MRFPVSEKFYTTVACGASISKDTNIVTAFMTILRYGITLVVTFAEAIFCWLNSRRFSILRNKMLVTHEPTRHWSVKRNELAASRRSSFKIMSCAYNRENASCFLTSPM